MTNSKTALGVALVAVVIAIGAVVFGNDTVTVTERIIEKPVGAVPGPDYYNKITLFSGVDFSSTFATTSTGAGTLSIGDIKERTTILSTNAGALTLTLPASTTMNSFLPKAGDRASLVIVNQGTTLLTLAGGTGTLLQTASSTKTVNIGGSATLDIVRKTNSDFVVLMSPAI